MLLQRRRARSVFHLKRYYSEINRKPKVLNIAVLGSPNAGKSTLINTIVGGRVSAVSHKSHTTRSTVNGIYNSFHTQLIFTDTPGIISYHEGKRLKMKGNHIRAPKRAALGADLLAVVSDASCRKTKDYISQDILDILYAQEIPAILILNKVDMVKQKSDLLFLTSMLTNDRQRDEWGYLPYGGYGKFQEVFYTCAKTGDGISILIKYLLNNAQPGQWHYPNNVFCDANMEMQLAELFREKILELFSQEIPWQLRQETVLFHTNDAVLRIHQKLIWPKKSQRRYVQTKERLLFKLCSEELDCMFPDKKIVLTLDISQKNNMRTDEVLSC